VGDLFVDLIALGVEAMPQWGQDTPCQGIRLCTPNVFLFLFLVLIYLIYKYWEIHWHYRPVAGGSALNTAMSTSAALGLDDDRSRGQDGVVLFGAVGRDHFGHTLVSIANQSAVDTTGLSSPFIYGLARRA